MTHHPIPNALSNPNCSCAVCTAGTVLVASAFSIAQLVIGRLILGVGVGLATQATPLYLSEMAPYNLRGGLNILFQLAVTIGTCGRTAPQGATWHIALAVGA